MTLHENSPGGVPPRSRPDPKQIIRPGSLAKTACTFGFGFRGFWVGCYGMDCLGTYFTHVQTCNVTRVQSATQWTASVHTLHASKPVM